MSTVGSFPLQLPNGWPVPDDQGRRARNRRVGRVRDRGSPVTVVIREDPQPSASTGSRRPQMMVRSSIRVLVAHDDSAHCRDRAGKIVLLIAIRATAGFHYVRALENPTHRLFLRLDIRDRQGVAGTDKLADCRLPRPPKWPPTRQLPPERPASSPRRSSWLHPTIDRNRRFMGPQPEGAGAERLSPPAGARRILSSDFAANPVLAATRQVESSRLRARRG